MWRCVQLISAALIVEKFGFNAAGNNALRLINHMFTEKGYNALIRPVPSLNDTVKVLFGLAMIQLIHVEEKSQIMKSNVWLRMLWIDYQLTWDPADFGGIHVIRISPQKLWKPDIVLFNNADGKYEVTWRPNILVSSDGTVMWIPPAIYKSSCTIDVEYFPFDQQTCKMMFGSWTFDATQVQFGWYEKKSHIDLSDYWKSGSWDIINCPGSIENITKEGQPPQTQLTYSLTLRRKTLFYTVNLIIPCVLISFLSVCVFYLPADAGEKMTLCVSILLALVVFLLLVSKILPPTSKSIPLISKYLLFTFIMNIFTIVITVIIINWNFRTPRTHKMSNTVKLIFMHLLPRLLLIKQPDHIAREEKDFLSGGILALFKEKQCTEQYRKFSLGKTAVLTREGVSPRGSCVEHYPGCKYAEPSQRDDQEIPQTVSSDMRKAIASVNFIATHLKIEDEYARVLQDWKYVASVIDRIQLIIFVIVSITGTISVLMNAPYILETVNQDEIIKKFS